MICQALFLWHKGAVVTYFAFSLFPVPASHLNLGQWSLDTSDADYTYAWSIKKEGFGRNLRSAISSFHSNSSEQDNGKRFAFALFNSHDTCT